MEHAGRFRRPVVDGGRLNLVASRPRREPRAALSSENGRTHLEHAFRVVEMHVFRDSATYGDVPTFMASYCAIGRYRELMEDEAVPLDKRQRLTTVVGEQAARHMESTGNLSTDVLMGAFVCRD